MTDTLTQLMNGRGFSAPVRNRYFYGKLLDVHNLEMEQRYFLEMGHLVNRLTLGSGVLCGLHVRPGDDDGTVVVSPGVAVDGSGREIVVTESVTLDLAKLAPEDLEMPAADHDGIVLCLCYHECDVEPAPVLVVDCDVREDCAAGAVRERFKFTLMPAGDAPLPEDPCSIMRGRRPSPTGPADDRTESHTHNLEVALAAHLEHVGTHSPGRDVSPAATLRQQLCSVYKPPCGPGPDCVPIALIRKDGDAVAVD